MLETQQRVPLNSALQKVKLLLTMRFWKEVGTQQVVDVEEVVEETQVAVAAVMEGVVVVEAMEAEAAVEVDAAEGAEVVVEEAAADAADNFTANYFHKISFCVLV